MSGGKPAARVGDPIAHSNAGTGMIVGALIGLAAGAVLVGATIATGGAALAVVAAVGGAAGLTSFGGLSGMNIGGASMGPVTGHLVRGSTNVKINGRFATMTEQGQATCDDHSGQIPLATGAATVKINGLPAGRIGEKLGCSALVVAPCSPDVNIGGPTAADPNVVVSPEVPAWAVTGLQALGIAGAIMALPYAIATVGVAATIGGGVAGYFGGEYGGKAGAALGRAMGMSETGIRSMQAGGQFLGGFAGGVAGVKGVQAGEGALAGMGAGASATPATALERMPPDFQAEHAAAKAVGWKKPDGSTWWPPNNGGIGDPVQTTLPTGTLLDRYGAETGSYMSPAGEPFEARALPAQPDVEPTRYVVDKPLTVEQSKISPWFDQPGEGTQYRLVDPDGGPDRYNVGMAKRDGYLKDGPQ